MSPHDKKILASIESGRHEKIMIGLLCALQSRKTPMTRLECEKHVAAAGIEALSYDKPAVDKITGQRVADEDREPFIGLVTDMFRKLTDAKLVVIDKSSRTYTYTLSNKGRELKRAEMTDAVQNAIAGKDDVTRVAVVPTASMARKIEILRAETTIDGSRAQRELFTALGRCPQSNKPGISRQQMNSAAGGTNPADGEPDKYVIFAKTAALLNNESNQPDATVVRTKAPKGHPQAGRLLYNLNCSLAEAIARTRARSDKRTVVSGDAGGLTAFDILNDEHESITPRQSAAMKADPVLLSSPEGKRLLKLHLTRERNPKLAKEKKRLVQADFGCLRCAVCTFDFSDRYGPHGDGFIECHHTKPLSDRLEEEETLLEDLELVCANCHRMLHRGKVMLSIAELRAMLRPTN